jgi:lipid-A-disaccharide synthase
MLDLMVATKSQFPDYQYVIAGVSNLPRELYEPYLFENVSLIIDQTYDLLKVADAALVTSGTATLETALFEVPQVVCYRANWISYQIAKRLIRVPYISLVNLVAQKEVVKELIQDELTIENLVKELKLIIENKHHRNRQIEDYNAIKNTLGESGASERVGKRIVEILKNA